MSKKKLLIVAALLALVAAYFAFDVGRLLSLETLKVQQASRSISDRSSLVASLISAGVSDTTVVAPRIPRTRMSWLAERMFEVRLL
jgi:hypothetical protein